MERPKVIFLDAVGTLIGVKGSVGEVYSKLAQEFDVEVSADTLDKTFIESFKAAPPPIFPDADNQDILQREFDWWRIIALNTFESAGVLKQFSDFSAFFSELYIHFGTAEPWFVYPDVLPALINWRRMGIELGVLSNFDSRIYSVLQSLGLRDFFTSITISTEARAAKPDPQIFAIALEKHKCPPEAAWHIGDSPEEDYQAAKAAGLRGILINREQKSGLNI
ncbi:MULTISPECIES: HAD-IA family hydrolase [unclassified Tolypothrix]|uniref:HAD-IA family hydrolase n=1 Tax=unclassified Tolypothrix TaxID=2649714 RepID=UPI0005EAA72E|nr:MULTISPECIES: HAD family hydrolase [unclassified Tolypothrix]BAY94055.1 hydrolase [Microchaete diplosiphon NIES-3275]EKF03621.1 REG-2-like, HADfamily hydrolase [Tolypothrix sp. PCC 7601]MBE9081835.1 HAD family hydrolase [Tolypothrix sp. LEGE 11397]UYD27823.1 HAD family hydrolase [Tolypothrix sp. PCC 7712]UYD36312.1 HAD family hydrolase [Tolypothrix sp. PCC 7601]